MAAVKMLTKCGFRSRWRSALVLTLLVGVVGVVVLSTVAGARRTETALARFNASSRSSDVQFTVANGATPTQLRALAHVPGVAGFAPLNGFAVVIPRFRNITGIAAATDAKFATVVDDGYVVAGRAAHPSAVNEITIDEVFARGLHLRVGDHLDAESYSVPQIEAAFASSGNLTGQPKGPRLRLQIVGIVRRPLDLGNQGATGVVFADAAFNRYYTNKIGSYGTIIRVRTRHGAADVTSVVASAKQVFAHALGIKVGALDVQNNGGQNAINVLTAALWIFAGVIALAGGVTIAIVLAREISLASVDQTTLAALGLTRRQRVAMNGLPALLIAGAGALLAVLGAIAASPVFPIGLARRAEPNPGVHLDWLVLALGFIAVAAVIGVISITAAVRSTRRATLELDSGMRRQPSRIVGFAARSGMAPTATSGLRMALEPGRGRTGVPVRSAYLGAVFGVAGLIAVLMFAANVNHLAATPHLYGWTADFAATDQNYGNEPGNTCGPYNYGLAHAAGITAVAAVCTQPLELDRHPVTGFSFTDVRGTIQPEVIQGRAPRNSREIALGATTLHTLNEHIGDTVQASGPKSQHDYRIVGQIVLPGFAPKQPLADGATFTDPGIQRIFDGDNSTRYLLLRFAPGVNQTAIEHRIAANHNLTSPTRAAVPPEIDRLRQIDWFPTTLAVLLVALALLAVGHALVTAVRRRRRDLALLKTLGFTRRQVRATVAWQATTLATFGLIIGIPAGLILGQLVWRLVADSVGVSTTAAIPTVALALTVAGALVVVNLVAQVPARAAARIRPADALRSE